jgi:uncharacterized protein (UPF0332 family)
MTPEQSALLSTAHDSVRAAKLLSDAGLYDFAVSRAYYSTLLCQNPLKLYPQIAQVCLQFFIFL